MSDAPILIAALVIATIWGIYLFPSIFGNRRQAPLDSTEKFDRWTHVMADVQRSAPNSRRSSLRDVVRARRRRTLAALGTLAAAALVVAYLRSSVNWLLVHLVIDAAIAWYIGMLMQVKQRQAMRSAIVHAVSRPAEADEPQVRIIAGS